MAEDDDRWNELGDRLRAARNLTGMTLQAVADKLTALGYETGKGAVGHWETGARIPDALVIRRLARLYGTTTDALLSDDVLTLEAVKLASEFDTLKDEQHRRTLRAIWEAFFREVKRPHSGPDRRRPQPQ